MAKHIPAMARTAAVLKAMCVCPYSTFTCSFAHLQIIHAVINRSSALSPLGITITGGVSSPNLYRFRDPGLYILKLTERGAAYENGTLQAGDRILAVSGNQL